MNFIRPILLALSLGLPFAGHAATDARYVPPDAGLNNVREKFGAKGDGVTDDTAAIQRAIDSTPRHQTLWLPAGTYLVSTTLTAKNGVGPYVTLRGEGAGKTVIRLKDGAKGFANPAAPAAVLVVGNKGNMAHGNYLFDLTINTGKGNPGAIALDYNTSNYGSVVDVDLISGDGQGAIGLALTREVGPGLIRRVTVRGFDVGIKATGALYGIALEHCRLENQNQVGLWNDGNVLAVRKLTSVNKVPAIRSKGTLLVLVDSELTGGDAGGDGIEAAGAALIRNVKVAGYKDAGVVEEKLVGPARSLFGAAGKTLNLPVVESPEYHDADPAHWANVASFHQGAGKIKAAAVQAAIDSGKPVVYFPAGRKYNMDETVIVRGNVRRIIGYGNELNGFTTNFRCENNEHPVIIEGFKAVGVVEVVGKQPVALQYLPNPTVKMIGEGRTVCLDDVVSSALKIGKGQRVYARQFNIELPGPEPMVTNDGGLFWALLCKTEFGNTVLKAGNGSQSELLGGLFYVCQGFGATGKVPAIILDNAAFSGSWFDICFADQNIYDTEVRETAGKETKELTRRDLGNGTWMVMPLYVGGRRMQ